MRKRIWHENDFFPNMGKRLDMDPRVVTLPSDKVPLFWNFNQEKLYGWVTNVQLEDGEIWGDLEFKDNNDEESVEELFENDDVRLGGYYADVEERAKQVTKCTLRSVSLVLEPIYGANPKPREE